MGELRERRWVVRAIGEGNRVCPDCDEASTTRHSWHFRRRQDLPIQGIPVTIELRLGRWRCRAERCSRKTFVERLPAFFSPFARKSLRLSEIVRLFGYVAGGRPGERLLSRLALPTADTTILRHLKIHASGQTLKTRLRVVGVDDWCWRRGNAYGTIFVDLEAVPCPRWVIQFQC